MRNLSKRTWKGLADAVLLPVTLGILAGVFLALGS